MAATNPSIELSAHALPSLTTRNFSVLKTAAALHLGLGNRALLEYDGSGAVTLRTDLLLARDLYDAVEHDYEINHRKSLRDLKIRWRKHLQANFAEMPVTAVTTEQITAYIAKRLQESAANATINRELAALKRMYKLAIATGRLKFGEQPYFPMLKERNVRKGFGKDAQYSELARTTGEVGLWLRGLFELGYSYGWRKSELLGLRVSQLDFAERMIVLYAGETKNDEARMAPMTDVVYQLLLSLVAGKTPESKVFTRGAQNRPIAGFRKAWAKATAAAKCPGLLFHDLRRSGVRNLRRLGVAESVAMKISGHKTASVFRRYDITDEADIRQAVSLLDKAAVSRRQRALFEQQAQLTFEDLETLEDLETQKKKPTAIASESAKDGMGILTADQTRCSGVVTDKNHVLVQCTEMFTPTLASEKYHSQHCYQFTRHRHATGFVLGDIYIKGRHTRPKLTREERSRIASDAAKTRWSRIASADNPPRKGPASADVRTYAKKGVIA